MQNFREKYAYILSLIILIIIFIESLSYGGMGLVHVDGCPGNFLGLVSLISGRSEIYFIFVLALFLRLFSLNKIKKWKDILVHPFILGLTFCFNCYLYTFLPDSFLLYLRDHLQIYSLLMELFYYISIIISLILSLKYLFELRKRENLITE